MKNFSEILIRQKRAISLNHYGVDNLDSFETATDEIIRNFYRDLKVFAHKDEEFEKKIIENYNKTQTYETAEQSELIDEQLDCQRQIGYINGYLDSLTEMKVVYLFKSIELIIKDFIKTAYLNIDVKSFFKWENIKEFFKGHGIDISLIDGYQQCVELKKINNCIKHNGILTQEIQSITEFANSQYLKHEQLELFYTRINNKVKLFCFYLKEKIKEDLYTFSDERLNTLATDFHERMDDKTILMFLDKLSKKLE